MGYLLGRSSHQRTLVRPTKQEEMQQHMRMHILVIVQNMDSARHGGRTRVSRACKCITMRAHQADTIKSSWASTHKWLMGIVTIAALMAQDGRWTFGRYSAQCRAEQQRCHTLVTPTVVSERAAFLLRYFFNSNGDYLNLKIDPDISNVSRSVKKKVFVQIAIQELALPTIKNT